MTLTAHGAGAVAVGAFALPALGFAAGSALFDRPPATGAGRRPDDFPTTLRPARDHDVAGIGEVGKTTVYMRARNDEIDQPPNPPARRARSSRSRRAACTSAARSATSRPRALHLPVPRRRLRLPRQVDGGPPVRPLDRFYTRVRNGQVEVGPRYSVNSSSSASRATAIRRRTSTASASTSTRPLLDARSDSAMKLPLPPRPDASSRAQAPGRGRARKPLDQAKEAGHRAVDWVDERTSLSGGRAG
jgi:hypothetical protein